MQYLYDGLKTTFNILDNSRNLNKTLQYTTQKEKLYLLLF